MHIVREKIEGIKKQGALFWGLLLEFSLENTPLMVEHPNEKQGPYFGATAGVALKKKKKGATRERSKTNPEPPTRMLQREGRETNPKIPHSTKTKRKTIKPTNTHNPTQLNTRRGQQSAEASGSSRAPENSGNELELCIQVMSLKFPSIHKIKCHTIISGEPSS